MILKSVLLENFRQFKGQQKVELLPEADKNVVIVTGPNGAGKTNLLKAIDWCIYGESGDGREIISRAVLSEASGTGDRVEAKVTVRFAHDGHEYVCRRRIYGSDVELEEKGTRRDSGKGYDYEGGEDFYFGERKETGETNEVPNPNIRLNAILPRQMRTHFFFDGEKINEFTKPGHESKVKEGIREVLQTEALERADRHLEAIADEYNSILQERGNVEVKGLAEDLEKAKDRKARLEEDLSDIKEEKEAADHAIFEIDRTLKRLEKTKEKVEERDKLLSQNESLDSNIEDAEEGIRKSTTLAYLALGEEIYREAEQILEEMLDEGEVYPVADKRLIEDLLDSGVCICGREFEEGSPEEEELESILTDSDTESSELALKLPRSLKEVEFKREEIMENLNESLQARTQAIGDLKSNKERLKEISDQIEGEEEEEGQNIKELERKRREFKKDQKTIEENKWEIERDLEDEKKNLKELNRKLEKVKSEKDEVEDTRQKQLLAEKSKEIVKKVYERFLQGKREEIEREARRIFEEFIWKDSQFRETTISEDFELEVLDRWGTPARRELSAGERQCFSLAFIMGMAHSVNIEAPFILDTPFARISERPLKNIATNLPDLTDQLILLATSKEFPSEDRKQIKSEVAKEYRLNFDDSTGCTSIQEVK